MPLRRVSGVLLLAFILLIVLMYLEFLSPSSISSAWHSSSPSKVDLRQYVSNNNERGGGSLFCWTYLRPDTVEAETADFLYTDLAKVCDEVVIVSNKTFTTPQGVVVKKGIEGPMDTRKVGSRKQLAVNAGLFYQAFGSILEPRLSSFDWVVKVDPDSVVDPPLLATILSFYNPTVPISLGPQFIEEDVLEPGDGVRTVGGLSAAIMPISGPVIDLLINDHPSPLSRCISPSSLKLGDDHSFGLCLGKLSVPSLYVPTLIKANLRKIRGTHIKEAYKSQTSCKKMKRRGVGGLRRESDLVGYATYHMPKTKTLLGYQECRREIKESREVGEVPT